MNELTPTPISISVEENLGDHLELHEIMNSWGQITDITGVPLDSDRSSLSDGIDFALRSCPYANSPSRYIEGQMISGLEQTRLQQSYADIRRYLLAARASYLALTDPAETERQLLVIDGINILAFMQYLPTYLVNRANSSVPAGGSLPQHLVVGANSASGGIGAIGSFAKGELAIELPSGEAALKAAETEGSLVGEKTVCAASPAMIVSFLELLRSGNERRKFGDISVETSGLLSTEEFGNALVFGGRMEELLGLRRQLSKIDYAYVSQIEPLMSSSHNKLSVWRTLAEFRKVAAPLIVGCIAINAQLNLCLGRESAPSPSELHDIWSKNNFKLQTLRLLEKRSFSYHVIP